MECCFYCDHRQQRFPIVWRNPYRCHSVVLAFTVQGDAQRIMRLRFSTCAMYDSMREAFFLRQLFTCQSPQDVLAWAQLNESNSHPWTHGDPVPSIVYQTYMKEHAEAKFNMESMMPPHFARKLFVDADCESFIKHLLGSVVLDHYRSMSIPAHKADFFRYLLSSSVEDVTSTSSPRSSSGSVTSCGQLLNATWFLASAPQGTTSTKGF